MPRSAPGPGNLPLPFPNTGQEIRVVAWRVADDWSSMTRTRTVPGGIPVNSGGRHAGCGLTTAADGTMWIGTGDNAVPPYPQSRTSLRQHPDRHDVGRTRSRGRIPGTPIFSLGHRNVQGIAVRPDTGRVYSIDRAPVGTTSSTWLQPGGNYGYRPDRIPGVYDESVPMTDPACTGSDRRRVVVGCTHARHPGADLPPTSGWGPVRGRGRLGAAGQASGRAQRPTTAARPAARTDVLTDTYGRLRGLGIDRDGILLVTTDNGGGTDRIPRVRPAG